MVANRDPRADAAAEPCRALQCDRCGRRAECSADELLRYTRDGWPRCCGRVMTYLTEPTRPATPDPRT